jgi:hypothetical protein
VLRWAGCTALIAGAEKKNSYIYPGSIFSSTDETMIVEIFKHE